MNCNGCGKFIAYRELQKGGGGSWAYVPDSHLSYEENLVHCKKCTETKGEPTPSQLVNLEVCQGTY